MGIENIDSLKPPPQADQTSDEIVIVPLFDRDENKIGEAYFVKEADLLNFRSVQIYGQNAIDNLGLIFALSGIRDECVAMLAEEEKW